MLAGLQIAHFEKVAIVALGGTPKTTTSFPAAGLRHDRGVQIRYALGHGGAIGQLFNRMGENCDGVSRTRSGIRGCTNRSVLEVRMLGSGSRLSVPPIF